MDDRSLNVSDAETKLYRKIKIKLNQAFKTGRIRLEFPNIESSSSYVTFG